MVDFQVAESVIEGGLRLQVEGGTVLDCLKAACSEDGRLSVIFQPLFSSRASLLLVVVDGVAWRSDSLELDREVVSEVVVFSAIAGG